MRTPFTGDDRRDQAIIPEEGELERKESKNTANTDSGNRIACSEGDRPMQMDCHKILTHEDIFYIRNRIAEGIARALVKKVAKSAVPAVDKLETERYNPSTKKGGC